MEKTVERIARMERAFDALKKAQSENPQTDIQTLMQYMKSGQWLSDYERDERGELPPDLGRGVLSQDALYNLLKELTTDEGEVTMLEAGMKAPDFALMNQHGETVRLSDFAGRKVILYFYPRDNTPGCTRQACAFAGSYAAFGALDAAVIGVSKDSVASHVKFAARHDLPFVLLSDPELEAIRAYGVWQEKKLYGKVSMGVVRTTYVIDENGVIEKVMPKVKPDTNAQEILAYLQEQRA